MLRRGLKSEAGVATVEFAIVGVLLFTLLMGIIETGRVFNGWLVITNEAREGARWGAVRIGDPAYASYSDLQSAIVNTIITRTQGVLVQDPTYLTIQATANDQAVTVRINYKVEMTSPLMASMLPDFQLSAESVMRSE